MGEANGLLVQARQNPLIYTFIILIIAVILLFVMLSFFVRSIERLHSSPEWIEAHKSLPTKKKNVKHVARIAELLPLEENLLWQICRDYAVPNIEYSYRNDEQMDGVFRQKYMEMGHSSNDERMKHVLFSIRYKLERSKENVVLLTSTKHLSAGQELFFFDGNSRKWVLKVTDVVKNGLYIELPKGLMTEELKPAPLSRLNISFNGNQCVSYGFILRIIRYETQKDGIERAFCSHTDSLKPVQRRNAKRLDTNSQCLFSAVKVEKDKNDKNFYEVREQRYKGILQDISSTGCRIKCGIPIKRSQYIYVEFNLKDKLKGHAIGNIVTTNKGVSDNEFILHVEFCEIEPSVSNDIYAYIYNYLN